MYDAFNELIKVGEQKERNHMNFNRYMDGLIMKMDNVFKQYK